MLAGVAFLTLALVLAAPAFACSPDADTEVDPARDEANSTVQVDGQRFDPEGNPVRISWDGAGGELMATAEPDVNGAFSVTVTIPADARTGYHTIVSSQRASNGNFYSAPASFEVLAPAGDSQQPPPEEGAQDEPAGQEGEAGQAEPDPAPAQEKDGEPTGEAEQGEVGDGTSANDGTANEQPDGADAESGEAAAEQPENDTAPEPVTPPVAEPATDAAAQPAPAAQDPVPAQAPADTGTNGGDDATSPEPAAAQLAADGDAAREPVAFGGLDQVARAASDGESRVPAGVLRAEARTPSDWGVVQPENVDDYLGAAPPPSVDTGPGASPLVLIPLTILGVGLFTAGAATFAREMRESRRTRSEI